MLFKLRLTLQQLYKDHLAIMNERAVEEEAEETGLVAVAPAPAPPAPAPAPAARGERGGSGGGSGSGWVAYKDGAGKVRGEPGPL